jgi:hypothetical protein
MKKMILFAVSLFAAGLLPAQEASTAADQVPIEEYVPKVIIEGKWGTGPGEFGVAWTYASDVNVPQDESGAIPPLYPSSLAVNSEGEIYILDSVNNRIQKFTADGTFIKSIPVDAYVGEEQPIWYGKVKGESGNYVFDKVLDKNLEGKEIGIDKWFPFFWPLTVQGINIVIDSKDDLYYYLKRTKDGKESGEVWQFRNDKLVKKTVVPVTNMLSYGVGLDLDREDDSLWIPDVDKKQRGKHYQFRTGKILDTDEVRKQKAAFKATEAGKKAAARSRPKYYLDIETSSNSIRVIEKLN